jgi:DNA-binding IclR family transcriptional regulator
MPLDPIEIVQGHLAGSRARSASEIARLTRLPPDVVRRAVRGLAARGRLQRDIGDIDGRLCELWSLRPAPAARPERDLVDELAALEVAA